MARNDDRNYDPQGLSPYPNMPRRQVAEEEKPLAPEWLDLVLTKFVKAMSDLTDLIEDHSRRVDEYQVAGQTADNISQAQTFPDYDTFPIIVESVIVTGPPSTACTLQLGKRNWTLTIPATGIIVIGPVKFSLDRNDQRTLTSATPGAWNFEVMGYADVRYR